MTYKELIKDKKCAVLLNQMNGMAEIYDLGEGIAQPLRSFDIDYATGLKVRNSRRFGGDTLFVSTVGVRVFSLDTCEVLWEAPGYLCNAHSVEWVEEEDTVCLAGSTDNTLIFYHTDNPSEPYHRIELEDVHGVLWDGEYLWATGMDKLLKMSFVDGIPTPVTEYTMPEGLSGAHDLAAVYGTEGRRLWITCNRGGAVVQFDKADGEFYRDYPGSDAVTRGAMHKGIGNYDDGTIIWMHPDGRRLDSKYHKGAGWLTDRIIISDGTLNRTLVSPTGRFYKLRVCNTDLI